MLGPDNIEYVVAHLEERVNPAFVILFGSYAKGTAHTDSDLDIAYYCEKLLSGYDRMMLANELAAIAGCDVDLVNLRDANTVLAFQIFSTGIKISCRDTDEFIKQRVLAYKMYAVLNEQRAGILEAIKQRGSVYGE
ncbi:type VII toxin-antitoxin system MntA family adenylyltransferase antitoxin [Sporosarcina trichiuri]|uniref:type VII toxin-antitoxin system MntA family adenylyltransferase antitoxin n=1 Tax=Sporosarcina trichiuri TaxID=3056445 RepID=UPI0025B2E2C7|nr:nucleotidyltransferase domain-containing protein [Sporosarcina sp. 0.2-SM1T-5]WJY26824.1 nucleotidyltransferase domain-containing protein [Sporosarcina sp. 0.2-SM1T-5]